MRILVRGGSIPAGVGVKKSYVEILRHWGATLGIEVLNRSRAGENSFDAVSTFREDIEPLGPDILILHFGVDDAFFPVYRSEFKENLVRVVHRAQALEPPPSILLLTSHLWDDPCEMQALGIYYRTIREVAVDLSCTLVPVHTFWAGYIADHGLLQADLVQKDARLPNEQGHKVFAGAVAATLNSLSAGHWKKNGWKWTAGFSHAMKCVRFKNNHSGG
ncbi:MAG: SGNH/GDSL hydrolase family protein [Syntrophaceae bacterium]|nr:SGNH/GDSL hydrolase family protein [Syntrophaceae bacterium]